MNYADKISPSIIARARKVAEQSDYKHQLGAVIFKGKMIISVGCNELRYSYKVPNHFREWEHSLHAECKAIISAQASLKGASILIVRLRRDQEYGLAYPCQFCKSFIEFKDIKWIFYSDDDNQIKREKVKGD
jgi:deoxycytidylate deaminase